MGQDSETPANISAARTMGIHAPRQKPVLRRAQHPGSLPDLSIIVPTYRQADVIGPQVTEILECLDGTSLNYEVLVVIDGDDGSAHKLSQIGHDHLKIRVLDANTGKGNAVRYGLLNASGTCRGFIDGGGDIHIRYFLDAYEVFFSKAADVVVASKLHRASEVEYPLLRRVYSWGYRQLTRLLFGLNIRDTQVGLKLYSAPVVEQVFPHVRTPGFAFDIESLALARRLGFTTILECPVKIANRYPSTIGTGTAIGMFLETLHIFWRLRRFRPDSSWSQQR